MAAQAEKPWTEVLPAQRLEKNHNTHHDHHALSHWIQSIEEPSPSSTYPIDFSPLGQYGLISLLENSKSLPAGQAIKQISERFLNIPYQADRLIGSQTEHEKLVIDLSQLDCFTFLDYVEALRRSSTIDGFVENLIQTRYFSGNIDYKSRRHFFSDWVNGDNSKVVDVTLAIDPKASYEVKTLNDKGDGHVFLPGIPIKERLIHYIPTDRLIDILPELQTGDYIGVYTKTKGLDVTHVGIFIRNKNGVFFRHESSAKDAMKVLDVDFLGYFANKSGIIVYRAK